MSDLGAGDFQDNDAISRVEYDLATLTLQFILGCQEMDLSAYVRQAYDGGAYSYLLEMLRSESFQESDVSYNLLSSSVGLADLCNVDQASCLIRLCAQKWSSCRTSTYLGNDTESM